MTLNALEVKLPGLMSFKVGDTLAVDFLAEKDNQFIIAKMQIYWSLHYFRRMVLGVYLSQMSTYRYELTQASLTQTCRSYT